MVFDGLGKVLGGFWEVLGLIWRPWGSYLSLLAGVYSSHTVHMQYLLSLAWLAGQLAQPEALDIAYVLRGRCRQPLHSPVSPASELK